MMTYKKGDRVHVKRPGGPEWDGVVSGIITSFPDKRVEIKLESVESVPESWLTLIKPKIEPQVGDIGVFFDGGDVEHFGALMSVDPNRSSEYQTDKGERWECFTPLARKLKTWEELSDAERDTANNVICGSMRISTLYVSEVYAAILALALPGYPEITHAKFGR